MVNGRTIKRIPEPIIKRCLPESAFLIESKQSSNQDYELIVICKWRGEFVTWVVNLDIKATVAGRHFASLLLAVEDYYKRK